MEYERFDCGSNCNSLLCTRCGLSLPHVYLEDIWEESSESFKKEWVEFATKFWDELYEEIKDSLPQEDDNDDEFMDLLHLWNKECKCEACNRRII